MTQKKFTIYPAIDLRQGKVVRLQYGDPDRQTTFDELPTEAGQKWIDAGADWLHVVNLDGAFGEKSAANWTALQQLTKLSAQVQFGGGMRSLADIDRAVDAGVSRVILGTVAVENPPLVAAAVERFGAEKVVVGIDARDGRVKTRGWQTDGGVETAELGKRMAAMGIQTIIHTDIGRDGVLTGVNAQATADLAQASGLEVIASGGVASLKDILRCAQMRADGVAGVITGRAIYDGRLDLAQAISAVS